MMTTRCIALIALLLSSACASHGPGRIPDDRFDYNHAISKSGHEQMLLNIVKLRYHDVPSFLAVSSILTQYVYTVSGSVAGSFGVLSGDGAGNVGAGVAGRFLERPTVTYTPMRGEEFTKQMLSPLPSELLFSLVAAGWPAEELMLMGLERMNDVRNTPFDRRNANQASNVEEFRLAIDLSLELAQADVLEMQLDEVDGKVERYMVLEAPDEPEMQRKLQEFRDLLELDPAHSRYRLTSKRIGRKPDELLLRSRNLLALMGYLSLGVEIPEEDMALFDTELPASELGTQVPLRALTSSSEPENAFIAVQYAGKWFYIEHEDERSREAFGLVMYLLIMMSPSVEGAGPLITIPTG